MARDSGQSASLRRVSRICRFGRQFLTVFLFAVVASVVAFYLVTRWQRQRELTTFQAGLPRQLIRLLRSDPSLGTRVAAARALGRIGGEEAARVLVTELPLQPVISREIVEAMAGLKSSLADNEASLLSGELQRMQADRSFAELEEARQLISDAEQLVSYLRAARRRLDSGALTEAEQRLVATLAIRQKLDAAIGASDSLLASRAGDLGRRASPPWGDLDEALTGLSRDRALWQYQDALTIRQAMVTDASHLAELVERLPLGDLGKPEDPEYYSSVMEAIGLLPAHHRRVLLGAVVDDKSFPTGSRCRAIELLGEVTSRDDVVALRSLDGLLRDTDPAIREVAAEAIGLVFRAVASKPSR